MRRRILKDIVNFNEESNSKKKVNKKKIIIAISIGIILLAVGITMLVYYSSSDARKFWTNIYLEKIYPKKI